MTELISIIIAAYNAESTLEQCIESALAQKNVMFEIIIIDDFSTDRTSEIGKRYANSYPSIIYQRLEHNSGPSSARNTGISLSRGNWFVIVDSDDEMCSDRLFRMYECAQSDDADIILDNMLVRENNTETQYLSASFEVNINIISYAKNNLSYKTKKPLGYLKPLIKKSFITTNKLIYNENLRNSEDFVLIVESLIYGAKIRYLNYPGYIYWSTPILESVF